MVGAHVRFIERALVKSVEVVPLLAGARFDSRVGADLASPDSTLATPWLVDFFYLETPPSPFAPVVHRLADAGLADSSRVLIEKPFGHDR